MRVGAAVAGAYFLAHASAAFLTVVLPFARPDRVIAASLLALPVWCAAAVYAFAARSLLRACAVPVVVGLALMSVAWLLPGLAVRP